LNPFNRSENPLHLFAKALRKKWGRMMLKKNYFLITRNEPFLPKKNARLNNAFQAGKPMGIFSLVGVVTNA